MPALRSIFSPILKRPWLSAAAGIVLVLLLALLLGRVWIAGDGGRAWLLAKIDGRKAGPWGTIEAQGLSGDPLDQMYLKRLSVKDAEGEWLVVENISLQWSPMALISGLVDVEALSAGKVDLIRRPLSEKQPQSSTSSEMRIKLRNLNIPDLTFQEAFAGTEAHFDVSGRYDQEGRALTARLDARPRDAGTDQLLVDISRDADGKFSLDADINGAANGIIANLIGLETGTGVTLKASAAGTPENASGDATLTIGEHPAATASLKIRDKRLTADARLDATQLPMLSSRLVAIIGDQASLHLESTTGRRDAPFGLEASLRTGSVSVRGDMDTRSWKLKGPATLDLRVTDIEPLMGEPGALTFTGTAAQDDKDWLLRGNASLSASGDNALPFKQAEGPIKLTIGSPDILFTGNLKVAEPLGRFGTAADLFGETSDLHAEGRFDRTDQTLVLEAVEATLAKGRVTTAGSIDLAGRMIDLSGKLSTALSPLFGNARGRVAGTYTVNGALDTPTIETSLDARDLSGLPAPVLQATGQTPALRTTLRVRKGGLNIESARLAGQRAIATAAGSWAWSGNSDIRVALTQSASIMVGDWSASLGSAQLQLTGRQGALRYKLTSSKGSASGAGRQFDALALTADIAQAKGTLSGPVSLRGQVDGESLSANAQLERTSGETRLTALDGRLGPGAFEGAVTLTDAGGVNGDISIDGTALDWEGGKAREAKGSISFRREGDAPLELVADLAVKDLSLGGGQALLFDTATANLRTAPEGYDIRANLVSKDPTYPTDLTFIASASMGPPVASGMFEVSGTAFGEPIATAAPAHWQLGDNPELDADLSVLGGHFKAGFTGGEDPRLVFDATSIDLSPILALYNTTTAHTNLEGHGDLRVFGASPSGTLHLVAASDVPGLETSLQLNVDGTLQPRGLNLTVQSQYGGRLALNGEAMIPVVAEAGKLVAPDRDAPLRGEASLKGDLGTLRTAALAFGHDVSGMIDAEASLSGTLAAPEYSGKAHIDNGTYELGSLGFQLSGITLEANYDGKTLDLDGTAGAPGGGKFSVNGKLAGEESQLTADFSNLMLYNRDGDHARGTGHLVLADGAEARSLSGQVFIDQARFSLENLPSARPHALDVRWTDDPPTEPGTSKLRRTLALDIQLDADRRLYVTGRGLDTEWKMDLDLTGTPADPQLDGTTTLIRGDLALAGRPFVFDSGTITFDGPPSRARINVNAERTVNGFDVKAEVTGSPVKPVIELSSNPDLPEDEILSRLLFGRSSMDLSALEAAQLANTIARLSGNSGGFDPASEVQAALGIDRLSIGTSETGGAEIGVGQYLSEDVYLELKSAGAEGSSVEVEWQPRPQLSVTSETRATGESKLSIRWKKDY